MPVENNSHYNLLDGAGFRSVRRTTSEVIRRLLQIEVRGLGHVLETGGRETIYAFAPHIGHADEEVTYAVLEQILRKIKTDTDHEYPTELIIPAASYLWYRNWGWRLLGNSFGLSAPMDTHNKSQADKDLTNLKKLMLNDHYSIISGIEGTRSNKPLSQRMFKGGLMQLAIETGVPVIPVGLSGLQDVMKKGELPSFFNISEGKINRNHVVIAFGEPVEYPYGTENNSLNRRVGLRQFRQNLDALNIWQQDSWFPPQTSV